MTLWITGAQGFFGSALARAAIVPLFATSHKEADIADLAHLRAFAKKHPGITHIVNCAAYSLVDLSESHRDEAFQANALGPENLGHVAQEIGAHLIHISTDYVFPGDLRRPLTEEDPTDPCNYYGMTKLEGERRLQRVFPTACILRTSWIFGRGGKNFVATLLKLLQEKEEVHLTDDQWGRFTYAVDLAKVILQMRDRSGIYHFANSGAATRYAFGCAMRDEVKKLGLNVTAKRIIAVPGAAFPSPCKRPAYSVFDTSKIERALNISIRPWQEGLKDYLCGLSVPSTASL